MPKVIFLILPKVNSAQLLDSEQKNKLVILLLLIAII